jgi:hypothetical protein
MRRVAVTCRCDGTRKTIPGWNYSWVVGCGGGVVGCGGVGHLLVDRPGRRLSPGPDDDLVAVTAAQICALVGRLAAGGRCGMPGQPVPMAILDCGYPAPGLADALAGVGVQLLVRLGDEDRRVFYADPPARQRASPGSSAGPPGMAPGSSWPTLPPGLP